MKRILSALTACVGVAYVVAAAQAQQYALPPSDLPSGCSKLTPKMSLTKASFDRFRRTTSIFAPISRRASGSVQVQLLGAGRITEFSLPVDSARARIRGTRGIDFAQARAATAVLTLSYAGDADTRAQTLRLRAALHPARLTTTRPAITPDGSLRARGTISRRARGVVRVQAEWVDRVDGSLGTLERDGRINNGRWSVNTVLPAALQAQIAQRCSSVQAAVLFTGYQPRLIRGEVRSLRLLPSPGPT